MKQQIIRKGDLAEHHKVLAHHMIDELSPDRTWVVRVVQYRAQRSLEQNSFLHAVPLRMIADHTGMEMDDIKEYLMIKAFGSREVKIGSETITRPLKGTSELNTEQFNWFLEWIEAFAAQELGMIIPKPNETLEDI